jgi:ribose transport system permease protein
MSAVTPTPAPATAEALPVVSRRTQIWRGIRDSAPIFFVLALLLIAIGLLNPRGFDAAYFLTIVKRAAPLAMLAAGELFVIVAGEFDLSVGSIVTVVVVGSAVLTHGDPNLTWLVIAGLIAFGVVVGIVNGGLTAIVGVPSFIVTLGMLLILDGGVALWTSGAPRGSLPVNLRMFGRDSLQGVPIVGQVPYAVFVVLICGAIAFILLHRTNFGRRVFAVGGNSRAAALAGVSVPRTKIVAFVLSALLAVISGILLAGFGGLSNRAGAGMEFGAISAVVLGGAVLGGGKGSVITAIAGAFTLEALFTVLNLVGLPVEVRSTVQGAIIIAAVAYASYRLRKG